MAVKNYTFAQKTCIKKSGLAMQKAAPLYPGCRIGVAVSGGVDSLVLLKSLLVRKGIVPFSFEIMALHCNPGFDAQNHQELSQWLASNGIASDLRVTDFGPLAHSGENRKNSPCFLCARLRRSLLFELCRKYRLTHLALGHNLDDLTSTFMMNLYKNGRVESLPIGEKFFNGQLLLIRPLLLVEKKIIRQAAKQWILPVFENPCPSAGKTMRAKMSVILKNIDHEIPGAAKSAANALARWQLKTGEAKLQSESQNV